MRNIKLLTVLGIGLLIAPYAHAQGQVDPGNWNPNYGNQNPGYQDPGYGNQNPGVNPNQPYPDPGYQGNPNPGYTDQQSYGPQGYVDPGPPPACPYGYYPSYPYGCAPYGYYGPSYFSGGVFIGVGPGAGVDAAFMVGADTTADAGLPDGATQAEDSAVGSVAVTPAVHVALAGVDVPTVAAVLVPSVVAAVPTAVAPSVETPVPSVAVDAATVAADMPWAAVDVASAAVDMSQVEAATLAVAVDTVADTVDFITTAKLSRPTASAVGRCVLGASVASRRVAATRTYRTQRRRP